MNPFSSLSLRNRFMLAPFIGVALTLILYFSSYSIIQTHTDTLRQLSDSNLPQISKLSHFIISLSENQNQLSRILNKANESLNEEQVYLQGKSIVNQLHDLEAEFNTIFPSDEQNNTGIINQITRQFIDYRIAAVNAIELSTVDLKLAKGELNTADAVRHSLNTNLLELTKLHSENLASSSRLIDNSLYDDNSLLFLTIFLIVIMMVSSYLSSNHLASNLDRINRTLLDLSNGDTAIDLPEQNDKYLNRIILAVHKFRETLLHNKEQQLEIDRTFDELKDSEQRYLGILRLIPTGIIAINEKQKIVLFNKAAEDIFGYYADEIIGQPLLKLLPEKHHAQHIQEVKGFANSGIEHKSSMARGPICGINKKGEEVELDASIASLKLSNENLMAVALTDITYRNKMEHALRHAQKMDAVGQLSGGIAHDFNNLLNIMLGNLELLDRQLKKDIKLTKYTTNIRKSTERAAELTKKLLGFSRHHVTNSHSNNINDLINNMTGLIARSLTPEVEIQYQLADNLGNVNIDSGDFEDVLINLVLNARDAMPDGGKLTIETNNTTLDKNHSMMHNELTPGNYIELRISDSGHGIPSNILEHIFEPFYTTKEPGKGTGLGLAMVFGFVNRSKASINVHSDEKTGTIFQLYFPESKKDKTSMDLIDQSPSSLPHGNETVLIVDDVEGLRQLAQESLQQLGYHTLTANDAHQALEILSSENNIDILFTDVVMPGGVNGFQLAEKAITINTRLKVLLTSGYTDKIMTNDKQEIFNKNVLAKPYTLFALASEIRNTLDS